MLEKCNTTAQKRSKSVDKARSKIRVLQNKSGYIVELLGRIEKKMTKSDVPEKIHIDDKIKLSLRMKQNIASLLNLPREECYRTPTTELIVKLQKEKKESDATAEEILNKISKLTSNLLQLSTRK